MVGQEHLVLLVPHPHRVMRQPQLHIVKHLHIRLRWRLETRKIFQRYLAAGYQVETYFPPGPATEGHGYYVLRAGALEPIPDSA